MFSKSEEKERKTEFKRNIQLEKLLRLINETLGSSEKQLLNKLSSIGQDHPLVFIMGPLRSGTTLLMQWIAKSGLAAYPTNLLSRFYGAPVTGAHIQLLLTDPVYNFRNEIFDFNSPITFDSDNGKTKGALAPNEFWYFWRRFLPFQDIDWLPDEELFQAVDRERLVRELTTLTRVFGKPFAMKGMILNYNIPFLNAIFEKAIFIQIKRDPITNISSILEARKKQLGSEHEWYSFKIPEYPQLKSLDPVNQCAGQLHYINSAVTKGMATLGEHNKLVVQYEDFCQNPRKVYDELTDRLGIKGTHKTYNGPDRFKTSKSTNMLNKVAIEKALANFQ